MGKNKIEKLGDISKIIPGHAFREAIKPQKDGPVIILQAGNIMDDATIDAGSLDRIDIPDNNKKSFTKDGDVVFVARGNFRAGVIRQEAGALAASSVHIIRIREKGQVIPEYLAVFLNSFKGQKEIRKIVSGSAVKAIARRDLEVLPVIVPDLVVQKKIIKTYNNGKRQQALLARKKDLIGSVSENIILRLLTK